MNNYKNDFDVFPWSDNFKTGIDKIDEQHKRLVEIINELAVRSIVRPTDDGLDKIFNELISYTDYHFCYEESVWEKYLLEDVSYREHKNTHENFLAKVTDLRGRLDSSSPQDVVEDALKFLIDWLIYHILDTDRKMAITVIHIESGDDLETAKVKAEGEVQDGKILTNTIISMYNALTVRSLHLLNERETIKSLSAKLEESERREKNFSETLINSIPGLLFVLDDKLRFVRWNNGFHQLLGYSDEFLGSIGLYGLFSDSERMVVTEELEKVDEFGSTQFEATVVRSDSSVAPYLFNAHKGSDGVDSYITFVGIDTTQLKNVEKELLLNQRLFEEAQRVANLGHWQLDHVSGELSWSDQVYRIFGIEPNTLTPSYEEFIRRVAPEDQAMVDDAFNKSLSGRHPYEVTHRLVMGDGSRKYVKETGKTEYSDSGEPRYTIGNTQDVTKDIEAELALESKADELKNALMSTISGVARALEARDPYTAGHQQRVAEISVKIAEKMGLDEYRVEGINLGASIHDLGKISVPAELLTKPVKLSEAEFMLIQEHAAAGFDILKDIHFPWPIHEIIAQHHEREDGSGYPKGLQGKDICLEAKIVAVADVFEAMSTNRPYREALGADIAIMELQSNKGRSYDATVVDALIEVYEDGSLDI